MGILITILLIYGLIATYYFVFRYLPTFLLYVLMAPVIIISPFIIAHRQIKAGKRTIGYSLYILYGLLYLFFIALAIF